MKKVLIAVIIILIISSVSYAVYDKVVKPDESELRIEKLNEEINYLSYNIIDIANELNNINLDDFKIERTEKEISSDDSQESEEKSKESGSSEESDESDAGTNNSISDKNNNENTSKLYSVEYNDSIAEEPDWDELKIKVDTLNNTWAEIIMDLNNIDINNEDILNFSSKLNELKKSVDNSEKINSISIASDLYQYIPKFIEKFINNQRMQKIEETKYNLLISYSLVNQQKLEEAKKQIIESEKIYDYVLNDIKNNKNQYNVNKIYILLKEYEKSIDANDLKVIFLKYKSVIEEIINVQ